FVLPLAAIGLYAWFGTPQALRPQPATGGMDLAAATTELRAKLQREPNHPEGWVLLAQAYTSMGRLDEAREAFGKALKLKPGDPDLMVAYAEADAQARPDHRIEGETRTLLERAVAMQPGHQRGLWLLGISDYQLGHYDEAASHWQRLVRLLPANSNLASAVNGQIAMAQARAHGDSQAQAEASAPAAIAGTAASPPSTSPVANASGPVALKIEVKLDPKLADKVSPNDTLFVFARAIDGPPMPLAVARLPASSLPATVTLTDAMAMTPQLKLSSYPRVQVSARISKSGDALPHAGDLESRPLPTTTDSRQPVALAIDRVH
ncbi:MAG TPA: tetratricopeptide repeat protein, partial [Rhodanobacteraceae bacterium]|nr:tetratricopeptide repeat protein [Rhodanobacteraceae bacterium]